MKLFEVYYRLSGSRYIVEQIEGSAFKLGHTYRIILILDVIYNLGHMTNRLNDIVYISDVPSPYIETKEITEHQFGDLLLEHVL